MKHGCDITFIILRSVADYAIICCIAAPWHVRMQQVCRRVRSIDQTWMPQRFARHAHPFHHGRIMCLLMQCVWWLQLHLLWLLLIFFFLLFFFKPPNISAASTGASGLETGGSFFTASSLGAADMIVVLSAEEKYDDSASLRTRRRRPSYRSHMALESRAIQWRWIPSLRQRRRGPGVSRRAASLGRPVGAHAGGGSLPRTSTWA